jgi:diacylglycerol kinase (ATP)
LIRFLLNPAAGRGSGAAQLHRLRILASRADAGLVTSRGPEDLIEQARRAAAEGVERLIVAGGDGTMHLAAQGIAGTSCALGVVPLGSGNDLAGTLGIPRDLGKAVQRALTGAIRAIDLVKIGGTWAIGYAGVGFDSEVCVAANQVRFLRGPLIYPWALLRTLATFVPPRMRIEHEGGVFDGRVMFAVAANLPRFGGGMRIAPDAEIDDGELDLVIVREISRLELLKVFPKVYSGRHRGHPAIELIHTRRVVLQIDRDMTLYGGGEPVLAVRAGETVTIEVVPGALRVVG